jgi:hypothetical protein
MEALMEFIHRSGIRHVAHLDPHTYKSSTDPLVPQSLHYLVRSTTGRLNLEGVT